MSAGSILARASVTHTYASTKLRTAVTIRRCSNRPFVHWMGGLLDVYACSSVGIMDDYRMYVSAPKEVNTFAGIASFILGTLSMEGLYK